MGLFGKASAARAKARKYGEVVNYLAEQISMLEANLGEVKAMLEMADNNFVSGGGEAEGKILTTFIQKEGVWSAGYKEIIMSIETGLGILKIRKQEAAMKKAEWKAQAALEEMKENGGF